MEQRNRGGQPGNQNARTHGFYSKKLVEEQKQDFDQAACIEGLGEEIVLLRVKIKSLVEHDADVKLIEQAVRTLARLVTGQYNIHKNDKEDPAQAWERAFRNIAESSGIDISTFVKQRYQFEENRANGDWPHVVLPFGQPPNGAAPIQSSEP